MAAVVNVSLSCAPLTVVLIHEVAVLILKFVQLLTLQHALPFSIALDLRQRGLEFPGLFEVSDSERGLVAE